MKVNRINVFIEHNNNKHLRIKLSAVSEYLLEKLKELQINFKKV